MAQNSLIARVIGVGKLVGDECAGGVARIVGRILGKSLQSVAASFASDSYCSGVKSYCFSFWPWIVPTHELVRGAGRSERVRRRACPSAAGASGRR